MLNVRGLVTTAAEVLLAALLALAGSAAAPASVTGASVPGPSDQEVLRLFLARPDEPTREFRARRHLEITSGLLGKKAWMDALVELDPRTGFRYTITDAGGSEMLQNKILKRVLEREQQIYASGTASRTFLTTDNYAFAPCGRRVEGLVCLTATARRKEVGLINGRFLVTPDTADIVSVSGDLARAPSFWIPRVEISKHYRRIQGHRVNVRVESRSHVRLLGIARFTMTTTYQEINGDPIVAETQAAAQAPAGRP